jgi:hypothetical protein
MYDYKYLYEEYMLQKLTPNPHAHRLRALIREHDTTVVVLYNSVQLLPGIGYSILTETWRKITTPRLSILLALY